MFSRNVLTSSSCFVQKKHVVSEWIVVVCINIEFYSYYQNTWIAHSNIYLLILQNYRNFLLEAVFLCIFNKVTSRLNRLMKLHCVLNVYWQVFSILYIKQNKDRHLVWTPVKSSNYGQFKTSVSTVSNLSLNVVFICMITKCVSSVPTLLYT